MVQYSVYLASGQKITCITATADKKIISVFCVSGVMCSLPQSAVQMKWFLQLFPPGIDNRREKKLINDYI